MKLSDKPCYPTMDDVAGEFWEGITFRERLIIALASNPRVEIDRMDLLKFNADVLIAQADAILKELDNEK